MSQTSSPSPADTPVTAAPTPRAGRNEWLLVTFTASTNIGDAVARVALPLLAVGLTNSPALIAMVTVLVGLPWLLTALHIGVFVDRMDRRTLMLGAEALRMASIGVVLAAYLTDTLSLPLIFVIAFVLGIGDVLAMTAGASIIPSAIPKARWQQASARITAVEYLCNGFVGTPIGGLLVAAGFAVALGTTSAIYVVGAVLLVLLVGNFRVEPTRERRPVNVEIKDGLQFLWNHTLLRTMALLIAVMAGCWAAWLAIIPAYAVGGPLGLDERQYGFLLTCLGAGGVVGALVTNPINKLLGRKWAMFVDILGSCALVAAPALLPAQPGSAIPIGVAAFFAGVGGTMWTVNSRVIYQSLVPHDMLGRFSAASRLVGWGMAPIAAGVAGVIATVASFQVAFGLFAIISAALVIPYLRVVTDQALAEVDRADSGSDGESTPAPAAGS